MLNFQDVSVTDTGLWTTERTDHSTLRGAVERSDTERMTALERRLRLIVTKQRPGSARPTVIDRGSFGVERKQAA